MEVDFCLKTEGGLIAMEVKNRQTIDRSDYSSLKRLQEVSGKDWLYGLVFTGVTRLLDLTTNYGLFLRAGFFPGSPGS